MAIVITDEAALEFWRWRADVGSSLLVPKSSRLDHVPEGFAAPNDVVSACETFMPDFRNIAVLVDNPRHFRKNPRVSYKCHGGYFPEGSLCSLGGSIYVTSPEYTFVRLASKLSIVESVVLGNELTGLFVMRQDMFYSYQQIAVPITTVRKISLFLKRSNGLSGVKNARRAAAMIVGQSASPRESDLAVLLTLPHLLGGYALPRPKMNYELKASKEFLRSTGRERIIVDYIWPESKFVIEYESREHHSGDEKFVRDSIRRNLIRHLGYDVTTVTREEYNSIASMDRIAKNAFKQIGKRFRSTVEGYGMRQVELRRQLLKIKESYKKQQSD